MIVRTATRPVPITHRLIRALSVVPAVVVALIALASSPGAQAQTQPSTAPVETSPPSGPIRLRQGATPSAPTTPGAPRTDATAPAAAPAALIRPVPPYVPGEFETYVQRLAEPVEVRRLGAELITAAPDAQDFNPLVPPDYLIAPGDEIAVTIWGSVDADLRVTVDRTGRINIPRVGAIMVSGVRYADLPETIQRRVAQVFKNFQLAVSMGQLRGVRVYVAGFVARPGAYNVNALTSVASALLRAGGPSAAGSFRSIALRRGAQVVSTLDLYDLVLKGDRSADNLVQADDVVHVGPVGPQIALIGSVNRPGVFEIKPGETITDVLRMAGGFSAVADTSRVAVERLDERSSVRITQLELPQSASVALRNGDVLRAFSAVSVALPVQRQNKRVRVEGEVARPGEYVLPPESTIADALRAAGGLTTAAYVFGTEFSRESVRTTQQENYERALRDLETEFARATTTQRTSTAEEAAAQSARSAATTRLVERLRAVKPTGRVVLQLPPDARELPDLALEDGDRLFIPPRATTVGVFGSVFNAGSYLHSPGRTIDDFLRLAGGPTRGADQASVFVLRANGSVISAAQNSSGWFSRAGDLPSLASEPGDTIFVPEQADKTTWVQNAKDWTQIFYQFGIGIAAIKALSF